jgi:hypothetical protein
MANRFQNLIDSQATTLPGVNRFSGLINQPTTNRFADLVAPVQQKEGLLKKTISSFGGAIGAVGRVLTAGQSATAGLIEKGLEKVGILKPKTKGLGIVEAVKEQKSNIQTLKRIGEETGQGGLLTGQYTPSTSIFGNFVRELPSTAIGLTADIFLDPLLVIGKLGAVAKGTKAIGKGIETGAKALAEEIPAVQKVGDMLGRAFLTRYGQSEAFKNLDIARKVEESLVQEKVGKLVSDVIEKPAVIQQRITQIIKGEVAEPKTVFRGQAKGTIPTGKDFTFFTDSQLRAAQHAQIGKPLIGESEIIKSGIGGKKLKEVAKSEYLGAVENPTIRQNYDGIKFKDGATYSYALFNKPAPQTLKETTEMAKLKLTDNELRILSQPIRQELDRVGESISKLNPKLLSEETFQANKGTYFPRLYTDYEFPKTETGLIKQTFGARAVTIPKEPFKQRILTEAESLAKGTRIEEAGYPAAKRLIQLNITEARQKFFKEAAKLATDEPKPGLLQLSEDKALGDLAGKFLPAAEYKAIAEIRKIPGAVEQIYNKALMTWKTFKTAYNPSTISRNDLTNFFILNPLGGVGPHRLDIYAKTANELISKGPLYQMARKEGLEISTQQAAELTSKASKFYRENKGLVSQFFGKVSDLHTAVKNFYGSQDKFFKLANFIKGVTEDGLTPQKALQRANFYLVDYSEVPQAIAYLRKSPVGIPFISFTYGVSKPLAKTLLERPDKLGAYFKILSGIQQMNPMGETPQERQAELDVTPDWIQQGTTLRLPVKDKYGRGQYIDLQYILPFNILESHSLTPSSPLLNILASALTNKDPFTNKDIIMTTDTTEEKTTKWSTYLIRQIVPSLAPFGYSWEKVKALLQNRPDANGYVRKTLPVLLDVLGGIKITPIDQTIEAQKRAYEKQKELEELRSNLIRIQTDKTLLPQTKTQETQKIQEKINKVFQ